MSNKKKTPADITPDIKQAVAAVLLARAFAETMRARVDEIQRAVLAECPLQVAPENLERGHASEDITDPRLVYLADLDAESYREHWRTVNERERKAGLKPDSMPDDHCPACVAECVLMDAQELLVKAAQPVFGATWEQVTRKPDALKEYIGLLCGLVVSLPDFRNPLTGKAA